MGLLAECKFCRQYVSSKYLDEHIRQKHFKEAARAYKVPSRPASAPQFKKKSVSSGGPVKVDLPLRRVPAEKVKDPRVAQAEREQQARRQKQAEANRTTANFAKNATLETLNRTPLKSVWQEQAVKLALIKDELRGKSSHTLHLLSVPTRAVPVSIPKLAPERASKKAKLSSAQTEAAATRQVSIPCTCGGENERCFKCFGTGLFEVSPEKAARLAKPSVRAGGPQIERPASFAADERGGQFGLRELGRFSSTPISDDYGEDSTS